MKGKVSARRKSRIGAEIKSTESSTQMAANGKREKKEIKFYSLENFLVAFKDSWSMNEKL